MDWYRRNARDLPWRRSHDPYRIWLSEIMLQQTRVDTVRPYYRRFLRAFPTVRRLAGADEHQVLKLWEGLGYYSRARNLLKTARLIVSHHRGRFPESVEELRNLPGVGRYTAGAIASIAYGVSAPILDGNVKRVLARLYCIPENLDTAEIQKRLWIMAEELTPDRHAGDFNQAMMELGAMVCIPKEPRCEVCPVRRFCAAHRNGCQNKLPMPRARKELPHYQIVAALIGRGGKYLIGRRRPEGLLGGLWELPGGKMEAGETPEQAVRREIREELDVSVRPGRHLATVQHAYSHFRITMQVYECRLRQGQPRPLYHTDLRWVTQSDQSHYAFPAATLKAFQKIFHATSSRSRRVRWTGA